MFAGRVPDGAPGPEGLQVQPPVALGGRRAPAMLGPVQAAGDPLNGGGVHQMDPPLEPEGQAGPPAAAEARLERLQMFQLRPEQVLGQWGVPFPVGVREGVLVRRGRAPDRRQRTGVPLPRVADLVEPQRGGQLGVEQTHRVSPRAEGAGVLLHAALPGQMRHQVRGNEIAELAPQGELAARWLADAGSFHALPCGKAPAPSQLFLTPQPSNPWDNCALFCLLPPKPRGGVVWRMPLRLAVISCGCGSQRRSNQLGKEPDRQCMAWPRAPVRD